MDLKKMNVPASTITRNLDELDKETGNIYQTVRIIAKRANKLKRCLKTGSK